MTIMADLNSDPLAWRPVKAPSLAELEALAGEVFSQLPRRFRELAADVIIRRGADRRLILDYWAEHDETLGAIIKHVLVHEIGHHFGLSDADMATIERTAG